MFMPITTISQSLVPVSILVRVSIAVKKCHDHDNSYKGHLIGGGLLTVPCFSPLLSWQEARQHAGRHGAGAEFLHFGPKVI